MRRLHAQGFFASFFQKKEGLLFCKKEAKNFCEFWARGGET
jgi:hypothetical protein